MNRKRTPAKPAKKLRVARENLRKLDEDALAKAKGGWNTGWGCQGGGQSEHCTDCCSVGTNHNQVLLRR